MCGCGPNGRIALADIPAIAHEYRGNGRTQLEWFMERYKMKPGIVNDPNEWFLNPKDLINAIRRIVYLSVETVHLVCTLPYPFDNTGADHGAMEQ